MIVMLFANGNSAVFHDNEQQPELQEPWIKLFAEFLESKGIDPLQCDFVIQGTGTARFFRTPEGLNWRIHEH